MRWIKPTHYDEPECGEVRVINEFLWFPKCINNEYRWLEHSSYKEKFSPIPLFSFKNQWNVIK